MAKNTVERTEGSHVITMKADPTVAIPKGSAIIMDADYQVTVQADQNSPINGVALEAHASGVYEGIPVLLAGPVLRVTAGTGGIAYGNLVSGDQATPGEWIVDNTDPAGFALNSAADGSDVDICFTGDLIV